MPVQVKPGDFPEDSTKGEAFEKRNRGMMKDFAPIVAAPNMVYRVQAKNLGRVENSKALDTAYCYSSWPSTRWVQVIPTYRPKTLASVAEFIAVFAPPDIGEIEVRPSGIELVDHLRQYPHAVEVEFDFPPRSGGTYPNRSWLTWFSWLRAGWEFLPVEEVYDSVVEYLLRAWQLQEVSREIHYPLYRPTQTGLVGVEDVAMLLEFMHGGNYHDRSRLQDQTLAKLGPRPPVVLETLMPREFGDQEEDQEEDVLAEVQGWGQENYDEEDLDDDYIDIDENDPYYYEDRWEYQPGCSCVKCQDYRQRRGGIV